MDIKTQLKKGGIEPDPLRDQFFLTDETIVKKMADLAELKRNDVVLEIGAGTGNITRVLAKKVGKIIAFEIDERFKQILNRLPENVEVHIEDQILWEMVVSLERGTPNDSEFGMKARDMIRKYARRT